MTYHLPPARPIEFAFVVACCRWTIDSSGAEALADLPSPCDPALLLAVARRHRVQGLIWRCIDRLQLDVGEEVRAGLGEDAQRIAADGLRIAAEMGRLADAFAERAIDLMFIKGLTLGQLAYADPFIKMGWDIDLLVEPGHVGESATALAALGYACVIPQASSPAQLVNWHHRSKESVWRHASGLHVELHSRLADNPRLIGALGMKSPRQRVAVAGRSFETLAEPALFAYLCVHGASSAWFRLKWINDLAALLGKCDERDIEQLYRASQKLAAGRAAGQALLLSNGLYGTPLGQNLARELSSDRATCWLADQAMAAMSGANATLEPTRRPLGTARIHLSQLALLPGAGFALGETMRQLRAIIGR